MRHSTVTDEQADALKIDLRIWFVRITFVVLWIFGLGIAARVYL